jgi:hypothetical protein
VAPTGGTIAMRQPGRRSFFQQKNPETYRLVID